MDRALKKKKWPKVFMFTSTGVFVLVIILFMTLEKDSNEEVEKTRIVDGSRFFMQIELSKNRDNPDLSFCP